MAASADLGFLLDRFRMRAGCEQEHHGTENR
jgi:hypothetical protein